MVCSKLSSTSSSSVSLPRTVTVASLSERARLAKSSSLPPESLRYKLLGGLAVRRAAYGVLRFVMENGARGCEVVISGKIRGQRAKAMKFVDGMMIHSGNPVKEYVDTAVRHVLLRQGVLGVKVKILKPYDETGMNGPKLLYPDIVTILEPKEEAAPAEEKAKAL